MNTDNFIWSDELVAEYSLTNQKMTLFEFKRFVNERNQNKSNDSFQWDDTAAIAFAHYTNQLSSTFTGRYQDVDDFKKLYHKCKYCGVMTLQPDEQCYKAPKPQAENKPDWVKNFGVLMPQQTSKQLYDQEQVDSMCEDAWNDTEHETYEDYKLSKQKQ